MGHAGSATHELAVVANDDQMLRVGGDDHFAQERSAAAFDEKSCCTNFSSFDKQRNDPVWVQDLPPRSP